MSEQSDDQEFLQLKLLMRWWYELHGSEVENQHETVEKEADITIVENQIDDVAEKNKKLLPPSPASNAARAMLKRCHNLNEVMLCPGYQMLYRYVVNSVYPKDADGSVVVPASKQQRLQTRLALIAGVLACVRKPAQPTKIAELMSKPVDEGRQPRVSTLRFRELLKVEDPDALFRKLKRLMPLVKDGFDVEAMIKDLYYWGNQNRQQWAFAYVWPTKE